MKWLIICLIPFTLTAVTAETEFERVLASYGNLETIAGTGEDEDGNFWSADYEGAKATSVELSNPHMTMADAAGNYYIADKESHSILKVDLNGILTTFAGTHEGGYNGDAGKATEIQLNSPNGLHVFPDGTVYILDFFNKRIRRVDTDGNLTTLVHDEAGFGPGRALWVSPDEQTVYFNGATTIKRWKPSIGIETVVDDVSDPGNLTVDPNGNLVFTARGSHEVFRLVNGEKVLIAGNGDDGEGTGGIAATEAPLNKVRGIAFLPSGGYFLATQKGGDIWYVDTAGDIHKFIDGSGSGNTRRGDGESVTTPGVKIAEPRAIALAANGDLIITTNDKGFVRVVKRKQPAPTKLKVGRVDEGLQLEWDGMPEQSYVIETSTDLGAWTAVSNSLTGASEAVFQLEGPKRFYRIASSSP